MDNERTFALTTADPTHVAQHWTYMDREGEALFLVFYTSACRWNRCHGCNLPSKSSPEHIGYQDIMAQIDNVLNHYQDKLATFGRLVISNNGSVLDEHSFATTALVYLMARVNACMPNLQTVAIETRAEYVDWEEVAFLGRFAADHPRHYRLELTVGFEIFDAHLRNEVFHKGLPLNIFERMVHDASGHGVDVRAYFMFKALPNMTNEEADADIRAAIDYLAHLSEQTGVTLAMHLNPTYVAFGTALEAAYRRGEYQPPTLKDIVPLAQYAIDQQLPMTIGLSDEGLAVEGGSFRTSGDEELFKALDQYNTTGTINLEPCWD